MSKVTKVKIGPTVYDIEVVVDLRDSCNSYYGLVDYAQSKIFIEEMGVQHMRQTMWHEIIHALYHQAGFDEKDEAKIDIIASGILMVLIDNPILCDLKEKKR